MSFLYGAFAGVRSHLSSIGTGARNGERSRRHTISAVVTSASQCPPLESGRPPGTLNSNADRAGRTTVQDSDSKALPPKRSRRKSVTFSSVDVITHLPTHPAVSATRSRHQSSKTREISVQTRRNSTPSPTSVPPSGLSDRRDTDGHLAPPDKPRRRRYTVSGSPLLPRLSLPPQGTDPGHASYTSVDREDPCPSPKCTQLYNYDWQPPSRYVAMRYQDSASSPGRNWYDHPTTLGANATQEMALPLQPPGEKRSSVSFGVLPSIDGGPIHFGPSDTLPYEVYSNPYQHPLYLSSPQNFDGPSIGSTQGYRNESYQQYAIYHVGQPSVVSSQTSHLFGPAGRCSSNSSNGVEYTILSLTSRLSPPHAQHSYSHPECLALLDARTASLVPSYFPPPKCLVNGKGIVVISHAHNNKGLGMFAQTSLRTGEVILTEVPTLVIPSDAPSFLQHSGTALNASTVKVDVYEKMFEMLSDGVRKELMDLAWGGAYGDHRSDVNVYETIMHINPLAVSLPHPSASGCTSIGGSNVTSSIHRGIFLKTSRCNHSCGPNAEWTFDPSSLTLVLTCLRPINVGDEITITYISPYLPFFHRRADLKNLFGFDCHCDWCFRILSQAKDSIQSRLIKESDSARKFLATFWDSYPSFEEWFRHPSIYPDNLLISAHMVALEMIEREGLEGLSSVQYSQPPFPVPVPNTIRHIDRIALCYGVLADVAKFKEWVLRALDARLSHFGPAADGWGAFEDIQWIGGNGKSLQQNEDDARLGYAQSQTDNIGRALRDWMKQPKAFPAWGSRRQSHNGKALNPPDRTVDNTDNNFM